MLQVTNLTHELRAKSTNFIFIKIHNEFPVRDRKLVNS